MTSKKDSSKDDGSLSGDEFSREALPDKIGTNLRKIYDDVLNEPVPDDFLSLLAQADDKKAET